MTAGFIELDLISLTKSLAHVNQEVNASRAGVLDAIRARGDEFLAASGQVNDLQRRVADLNEDLQKTTQNQPARPKEVQHESERHAQLETRLSELDDAIEILGIVLEARSSLIRVEGLVSRRSFMEASTMLQRVAACLAPISPPAFIKEPDMIRSVKDEYCKLRASLLDAVDERFDELVSLSDDSSRNPHIAGPMLAEVWALFQALGVRGQRLDKLSGEIRRSLLGPLLARAKAQGTPWLLESLTEVFHRCYYWCGEVKEVYAALGSRLYAPAARQLLSQFEIADGHTVERFESDLQLRGFISDSESPLRKHVCCLRSAKQEARCTSMLVEAKAWIQDEGELVSVDEATFGSYSQLLQSVTMQSLPHGLVRELENRPSLLRLPSMKVSSVLMRLVRCIFECMETAQDVTETFNLVRRLCMLFAIMRPHEASLKEAKFCSVFLADLLCLVHVLAFLPYRCTVRPNTELLALDLVPQFRRLGEHHFGGMLRYQQDQLLKGLQVCNLGRGAAEAAAYVASEAALGAAAQQMKAFCTGVGGLPAQILEESALLLFGSFCKELVRKVLATADQPLSKPHVVKVDLTAGVGRVVGVGGRWLETAFAGVGSGSGSDDFREVLAGLKGGSNKEASNLAGPQTEVWLLDAEDVSSVIALLTSAQAMVRQNLQAAGIKRPEDEVPGYPALQLSADLLGSDFSRFLQRRKQVLKALQHDEVIRLMKLSWQDEALTTAEAWRVLTSAGL